MSYLGAPTVLIGLGAVLSLVGTVWSAINNERSAQAQASASAALAAKSDEIARKNDEIANLNAKIAASITGGDAYAYAGVLEVSPTKFVLVVTNDGDYPLYDVSVRIADIDSKNSVGRTMHVGNIGPHQAEVPLDASGSGATQITDARWALELPPSDGLRRFNLFFLARNGAWTQNIRLKFVDGSWRVAMQVFRDGPRATREQLLRRVPQEYFTGAELDF